MHGTHLFGALGLGVYEAQLPRVQGNEHGFQLWNMGHAGNPVSSASEKTAGKVDGPHGLPDKRWSDNGCII